MHYHNLTGPKINAPLYTHL